MGRDDLSTYALLHFFEKVQQKRQVGNAFRLGAAVHVENYSEAFAVRRQINYGDGR
jgi:hypothetical protein